MPALRCSQPAALRAVFDADEKYDRIPKRVQQA
jgi:hypothetical protein